MSFSKGRMSDGVGICLIFLLSEKLQTNWNLLEKVAVESYLSPEFTGLEHSHSPRSVVRKEDKEVLLTGGCWTRWPLKVLSNSIPWLRNGLKTLLSCRVCKALWVPWLSLIIVWFCFCRRTWLGHFWLFLGILSAALPSTSRWVSWSQYSSCIEISYQTCQSCLISVFLPRNTATSGWQAPRTPGPTSEPRPGGVDCCCWCWENWECFPPMPLLLSHWLCPSVQSLLWVRRNQPGCVQWEIPDSTIHCFSLPFFFFYFFFHS